MQPPAINFVPLRSVPRLYPSQPEHVPGSWWQRSGGFLTGRIVIKCSSGHVGNFNASAVAHNGVLIGLYRCPHNGCGFQHALRLEDWKYV